MSGDHVEVRKGAYYDSVTLMQVSRQVSDVDGVDAAQVAMGTELNLDFLRGMGFEPPDSGPNDLVVAVRATTPEGLAAALERLETVLTSTGGGSGDGLGGREPEPRTIGSAVRRSPEPPSLALVSVPGPHAFTEAWSALQAGLSVLVFSDNVPVEQEIALKDEAARLGLLVMGPDCGTAVVGGVGLGFANQVRPGPVGIVAAGAEQRDEHRGRQRLRVGRHVSGHGRVRRLGHQHDQLGRRVLVEQREGRFGGPPGHSG